MISGLLLIHVYVDAHEFMHAHKTQDKAYNEVETTNTPLTTPFCFFTKET